MAVRCRTGASCHPRRQHHDVIVFNLVSVCISGGSLLESTISYRCRRRRQIRAEHRIGRRTSTNLDRRDGHGATWSSRLSSAGRGPPCSGTDPPRPAATVDNTPPTRTVGHRRLQRFRFVLPSSFVPGRSNCFVTEHFIIPDRALGPMCVYSNNNVKTKRPLT